MVLALRYAVRSDVGLVREGNEDAAFAGRRLLAVADGMGGHAAGEVASRLVVATVSALDAAQPPEDLLAELADAVDAAQRAIRNRIAADSELDGMGTTLTALLWVAPTLALAHVGDSRAYLLRDGALHQLTRDHTYVQELVDAGRIAPEEAERHPQRSLLTRALDGRPGVEPDLELREGREGDRYLVCSDGLSGFVAAEQIAGILAGEPDPGRVADALVAATLANGAPDNVTVVLADVVETGPATTAVPVVAGAAAGLPAGEPSPPPTTETDPPAPARAPQRRWRRALVPVLTMAVVAGLVIGIGGWLRSQYYVGVADGRLAIFRGLTGSVAGISLSRVAERRSLVVSTLPQYERERLAEGIGADNLARARQVAATIVSQVCTGPAGAGTDPGGGTSPTPTPTTRPAPTTSPAPTTPGGTGTGSPSRRASATRSAQPSATASPTPTRTPAGTSTGRVRGCPAGTG